MNREQLRKAARDLGVRQKVNGRNRDTKELAAECKRVARAEDGGAAGAILEEQASLWQPPGAGKLSHSSVMAQSSFQGLPEAVAESAEIDDDH